MIRLRSAIETALRHPVLGPFVLLLLAIVLVLVVLHVSAEVVVSAALAFCGTVAVVLIGGLSIWATFVGSSRLVSTALARPPTAVARRLSRSTVALAVPLRL